MFYVEFIRNFCNVNIILQYLQPFLHALTLNQKNVNIKHERSLESEALDLKKWFDNVVKYKIIYESYLGVFIFNHSFFSRSFHHFKIHKFL